MLLERKIGMYSNNRGPGPQSEWQVQFIAGAIVLAPITAVQIRTDLDLTPA